MPRTLKTPNDGAGALRTRILAKIKREQKLVPTFFPTCDRTRWEEGYMEGAGNELKLLYKWVSETDERAGRKKGGLGRTIKNMPLRVKERDAK